MPARHATPAARTARAGWAGVVAAAGALSLVAGALVLTDEQVVVAESFGPTAPAASGQPTPSAQPTDTPAASGPTSDHSTTASAAQNTPAPIPPARVSFTKADVDAEVVPVGVLSSGALQIPDDPSRVGWWAAGAAPGHATGSIVLAGHMDGLSHGGAMSVLLDVHAGDPVVLRDRSGATHRYRITSRATQPRENIDPGLFTTGGPHRLVLITCGGTYDEQSGQYTENIVVIAQPINDG